MILGLGPLEIVIILVIVLLIFGPKNLPKLGSSLGKTVKNVREGMEDDEKKDDDKEAEAEDVETVADEDDADADADADEAPAVFCSKCGAKNEADADFCTKCGAKLGE
jgi:sec-independent protein translocase protein TatA